MNLFIPLSVICQCHLIRKKKVMAFPGMNIGTGETGLPYFIPDREVSEKSPGKGGLEMTGLQGKLWVSSATAKEVNYVSHVRNSGKQFKWKDCDCY
jgi:hypothetical protein